MEAVVESFSLSDCIGDLTASIETKYFSVLRPSGLVLVRLTSSRVVRREHRAELLQLFKVGKSLNSAWKQPDHSINVFSGLVGLDEARGFESTLETDASTTTLVIEPRQAKF